MSQLPPPVPRRRSRGLLAVAAGLALALVAVIVVIVLARGADGDGDPDDRADTDAETACELLEDLPGDIAMDDLDFDGPEIFELQAIGSLATAAGNADGRYDEFGKAGEDLFGAIVRLDPDTLDESLGTLRSECDDID